MRASNHFTILFVLLGLALIPYLSGSYIARKDIEKIEAKAKRIEAIEVLYKSAYLLKYFHVENGKYSDNPEVVFDKGRLINNQLVMRSPASSKNLNFNDYDPEYQGSKKQKSACELSPKCLNYIYAVQAACENGGRFKIFSPSTLKLKDEAQNRLGEMKNKLNSLKLPCKKINIGFNVVAVGILIKGGNLDVVLIDESIKTNLNEDGKIKIIEDASNFSMPKLSFDSFLN